MSTPTTFKGIYDLGDKHISELITDNLIYFVDWGMLNIGGFHNVTIPTSGQYGGEKSQLKLVTDTRFTNGTVWESFSKNWVWETGLECSKQPINISGVFVDGAFHAVNSNHYIDYPNGRVIFNSPISSSSVVKLNYSYKHISVNDGANIPFLSRPSFNFSRIDNPYYNQLASGDYADIADRRIQLPTIAVEVSPITDTEGYELGSGARYVRNNITFHILSDNANMSKKLADILADQKDKTILMFDSNAISASGDYPLDYRGMRRNGFITYPTMVQEDRYFFDELRFVDTSSDDIQRINNNFYYNTVKAKTEMVLFIV